MPPPADGEVLETPSSVYVVGDEDSATAEQIELDAGAGTEDALLDCLVFLTRFHGRPKSAEVLKAGLPFAGPRLTPSMFVRAAERVGLNARVVKRRLASISKMVLPAILILDGGRACVLLDMPKRRAARVMLPETGGGEEETDLKTLESDYSGYAIFLRPVFKFEGLSEDLAIPRPRAWFWGTLAQSWWTYAQVVMAAILINIFALATPLFVMTVYDRVVPNNAIETLWVLAIGAGTVFGFDFILKQLRGYFIDTAGKRADVLLASRVFEQVLDMRLSSRPRSAGAFANTLREFESLRDFFTSATLAALIDLPFVVFFVGIVWLIGGDMVMIHAVTVPAVLIVGIILQIPLGYVVQKNLRESEMKHGVLVESLAGLETLKSLGGEARMRQMWENFVGLSATSSLRARVISQGGLHFATFMSQMTTLGVVVYGVFLIHDGELTVGGLIACVMLSARAMAPLVQVAQLLTRFHRSMVSLRALDAIMKSPVERPPGKEFLHRPELKGAVAFQDLRFAYPGHDIEALKGVSFSIEAGEKVGLIGRVGSGKSTVARLMLGLYEPTAGSILIDGTDIRQIDPIDLRRNIAYVPQDVFLFRGSVRDNITVAAPQAEDAAILRAANLAGVDDFVSQHPMGYDLQIGERGEGLSGGQRQAIAIARALIHDPPLLIFDEPTSSMDTRGEDALKTRLGEILTDRTLILVTHRASLLSLVDRLIVFDGGRIVADGPRQGVIDALAGGKVTGVKR